MASRQLNMSQIEQLGIADSIRDVDVLRSLAEIAAYMRCSIDSVRRYIKQQGLPAYSQGRGNTYTTTKLLIDGWIRERHYQRVEQSDWLPAKAP